MYNTAGAATTIKTTTKSAT